MLWKTPVCPALHAGTSDEVSYEEVKEPAYQSFELVSGVEREDILRGTLAVLGNLVLAVTSDEVFRVFTWDGQERCSVRFDTEGGPDVQVCTSSTHCYLARDAALRVLDTRLWVARARPWYFDNVITAICCSEESVWVATDHAIYKYDVSGSVLWTKPPRERCGIHSMLYCAATNEILTLARYSIGGSYLEMLDADTWVLARSIKLGYNASSAALHSKYVFVVNDFNNCVMVYHRAGLFAVVPTLDLLHRHIRITREYHAAIAASETHLLVQEYFERCDMLTVYSLDTWTKVECTSKRGQQ